MDAHDREAILSTAGYRLIERTLVQRGAVGPLLLLDSRLGAHSKAPNGACSKSVTCCPAQRFRELPDGNSARPEIL